MKKFQVSKVAVEISFFMVHRRFCDWFLKKDGFGINLA